MICRDFKKYRSVMRNSFSDEKKFMTNFYLSFVYLPLQLFVVYYFWKFAVLDQSSLKAWTSNRSMIAYFVIVNMIQVTIGPAMYVTYNLFDLINSGKIISWLLRPISYFKMEFSTNLIKFLMRFIPMCILVAILPWFAVNNWKSYIAGIVSIFLGYVLLFQIQYLIGTLTLKLKNVLTLRDNLMDILMLLGGFILPLDFYPEVIKKFILYTPLSLIYYVPSKILSTGILEQADLLLIGGQCFWIALFSLIITVIWKKMIIDNIENGG